MYLDGVYQLKRLLFLLGFPLLVGCSNEQSEELATAEAVYNTQLDTQQIMSLVLEPASDILWDSAGWVMDAAGYEDLYPTTDEGWDFVRAQAAIVVESGNMLALPGRAEDNDAWMIYSEGLSEVGLLAMKAAAEQNEEDFFQANYVLEEFINKYNDVELITEAKQLLSSINYE